MGPPKPPLAIFGRASYESVEKRVVASHRPGMVSTAGIFFGASRRARVGRCFPAVCDRAFRRKLAKMGFAYTKTRRLIIAERPKPYISRWGEAYCARRLARLRGGQKRRPRVWMGATFVNKHATRGFARS